MRVGKGIPMPFRPRRPEHPRDRASGWVRYPAEYRRRRAEAIAAEPWCHNPDGCPHHDVGTKANPLTADHPIPLGRGGDHDQPLIVYCKRCNSSKGASTPTEARERRTRRS